MKSELAKTMCWTSPFLFSSVLLSALLWPSNAVIFNGNAFAAFNLSANMANLSTVTFSARAAASNGVLLFSKTSPPGSDFLSIELVDWHIYAQLSINAGLYAVYVGAVDFSDSATHSVTLSYEFIVSGKAGNTSGIHLSTTVDTASVSGGTLAHPYVTGLNAVRTLEFDYQAQLFIGGAPAPALGSSDLITNVGFQGCIRNVTINSLSLDFRDAASLNDLSYVSGTGNIVDCVSGPLSSCSSQMNNTVTCVNGMCVQSWLFATCYCSIGFSGASCNQGNIWLAVRDV